MQRHLTFPAALLGWRPASLGGPDQRSLEAEEQACTANRARPGLAAEQDRPRDLLYELQDAKETLLPVVTPAYLPLPGPPHRLRFPYPLLLSPIPCQNPLLSSHPPAASLPLCQDPHGAFASLFAEELGLVIEVKASDADAIAKQYQAAGVSASVIGKTSSSMNVEISVAGASQVCRGV